MLDTFLDNLLLFNNGLAVAAGLLGLVRYRRLLPSLRWLALLAGFDAAMESTFLLLSWVFNVRNTMFLVPFVLAGEIVLQTLLYRQVLQSPAFNRVIPWLLGLFCCYALLNSPLVSAVTDFAVSLEVISDLIQIALAGLYFQKLLNELWVEHLRRDPFFWFSVALATHGLGNLLISLFSNYLLAHCTVQLQKVVMWGVFNVFNIILYLAYILALWMRPLPVRDDRAYSA